MGSYTVLHSPTDCPAPYIYTHTVLQTALHPTFIPILSYRLPCTLHLYLYCPTDCPAPYIYTHTVLQTAPHPTFIPILSYRLPRTLHLYPYCATMPYTALHCYTVTLPH